MKNDENEIIDAIFKIISLAFIITIFFTVFIGCVSVKPTSTTVQYTLREETVGLPPWQSKWERKHQPEDPDWRWNMPWDQDTFAENNIEFIEEGVKIWTRNGKKGCLYSNFSFKYGKICAMIRLPEAEGAWSAFWLFGESGLPENDVFEHCGGKKYVNVTHHWGYSYDDPIFKKHTEWNKRRNINPYEWNIFEVEITPYKTIYRINEKVVRTMKRGTSSDKRHILLTCGWGDYCGGTSPDAYMEVKWVKVENYGAVNVKR